MPSINPYGPVFHAERLTYFMEQRIRVEQNHFDVTAEDRRFVELENQRTQGGLTPDEAREYTTLQRAFEHEVIVNTFMNGKDVYSEEDVARYLNRRYPDTKVLFPLLQKLRFVKRVLSSKRRR